MDMVLEIELFRSCSSQLEPCGVNRIKVHITTQCIFFTICLLLDLTTGMFFATRTHLTLHRLVSLCSPEISDQEAHRFSPLDLQKHRQWAFASPIGLGPSIRKHFYGSGHVASMCELPYHQDFSCHWNLSSHVWFMTSESGFKSGGYTTFHRSTNLRIRSSPRLNPIRGKRNQQPIAHLQFGLFKKTSQESIACEPITLMYN